MDLTRPRLHLVTGSQGAGKTTFCRLAAERARSAGWMVAGLLSPARFEAGEKTGIAVECLSSGERRLLAVRDAAGAPPAGFNLSLGEWLFDPGALAWGNLRLENALPTGLFIVDELGPLEFKHHMGWEAAFSALRRGGYRAGLVVVRPALLAAARALLPGHDLLDLSAPLARPGGRLLLDLLAGAWWQQVEEESHV